MSNISDAEIVIIGGGAIGCGVAYNLALAGKTDVLIIEQMPSLASATTSQAAGLVGQVRSSVERVKLAMWSVATFSRLQNEQQASPSWRQVGSLRIALTEERVEEFQQLRHIADEAGLEVKFLDIQTAQSKWPVMSFDQVKAVLWCPSDGYLQPSDLTMAYASFCRKAGMKLMTSMTVRKIILENGRARGVVTNKGRIRCKTVINAAGAHAQSIAQSVDLELPIVPVRHEYFVTVRTHGVDPSLPCVRIPDATLYLRAEVNSLLVGGWERGSLSLDPKKMSINVPAPKIEEDWDVLADFGEKLHPHLPQVSQLGIRSVFKGWPTFTPDGKFIIGESSQVPGFVMAGGCNAHGVSGSAGIGRHVVESILDENPSNYVKSLSPDRFIQNNWNWNSARRRAANVYETYYEIDH